MNLYIYILVFKSRIVTSEALCKHFDIQTIKVCKSYSMYALEIWDTSKNLKQ